MFSFFLLFLFFSSSYNFFSIRQNQNLTLWCLDHGVHSLSGKHLDICNCFKYWIFSILILDLKQGK